MRSFRPDLTYWEEVLTNSKEWEKKNADGTNMYTDHEIKLILSTDSIAQSAYILGKVPQMYTQVKILRMKYVKHYGRDTIIQNNGFKDSNKEIQQCSTL
jgi:hypothetical protein